MLPRPGNSRRNSLMADTSPPCSNAVRMTAACASLTLNIREACECRPRLGKRKIVTSRPARQPLRNPGTNEATLNASGGMN